MNGTGKSKRVFLFNTYVCVCVCDKLSPFYQDYSTGVLLNKNHP